MPTIIAVMARAGRPSVTLVLALQAAACSTEGQNVQAWVTVDTLASGVVLVSNADIAEEPVAPRITLVEEMRVGAATGSFVGFGQVLHVVSGPGGRFFVADQQASEVLRFDARGNLDATIGRSGRGPGEFSAWLAGIVWQDPNRLWAADAHRIMAFDSAGALLNSHSHTRGGSGSSLWSGWADTTGMLYSRESDFQLRPGAPTIVESVVRFRVREDHSLEETGTFVIPAPPKTTRLMDRGGGLVEMLGLPMAPRALVAVGPAGTIWMANSSSYRIHEVTFDGDTLRTIALAREPEPLVGAERDSVAAASQAFSPAELPAAKPMMGSLRVDWDGWIWVSTKREGSTNWDIFDECGGYLGQVEPGPATSLRGFPGGSEVLGVTWDDLGVEYVVRFALQVPNELLCRHRCLLGRKEACDETDQFHG